MPAFAWSSSLANISSTFDIVFDADQGIASRARLVGSKAVFSAAKERTRTDHRNPPLDAGESHPISHHLPRCRGRSFQDHSLTDTRHAHLFCSLDKDLW